MTNFLNNLFITCDAPRPWGVYFQDSASPQMEALAELHDNIMFYLVIILFGVAWIMISIIRNYVYSKSPISNKYLNHGGLIELIWTITSALILILIAFPSFKLLYLMDEVTDPSLTVFFEGSQHFYFISDNYECNTFFNEENSSESGSDGSENSADLSLDPNDIPSPSNFRECTHDYRYPYPHSVDGHEEQEAISNTVCDVGLTPDKYGVLQHHNAFPDNYQGQDDPRRPMVCQECQMVICNDCSP